MKLFGITLFSFWVLCVSLAANELQDRINAAAKRSSQLNMTQVVTVEDGSIFRLDEPLAIPKHVYLTSQSGAKRSWRLVFTVSDGSLINFTGNSYGAGLAGVDIRVYGDNVTAIEVGKSTKNASIENIRFQTREKDCVGLHVRGHESLKVESCEFRCSVPVRISGGDNHVFRDLDLGTSTSERQRTQMHSGKFPCTCVWIDHIVNQWSFDGYQTYQGGDHAFFGRVDSQQTGQVLRIEGLRYEQSLSKDDWTKAAIDMEFTDRSLERLVLVGCRWGQNRVSGMHVKGCWQVSCTGCYLQGVLNK